MCAVITAGCTLTAGRLCWRSAFTTSSPTRSWRRTPSATSSLATQHMMPCGGWFSAPRPKSESTESSASATPVPWSASIAPRWATRRNACTSSKYNTCLLLAVYSVPSQLNQMDNWSSINNFHPCGGGGRWAILFHVRFFGDIGYEGEQHFQIWYSFSLINLTSVVKICCLGHQLRSGHQVKSRDLTSKTVWATARATVLNRIASKFQNLMRVLVPTFCISRIIYIAYLRSAQDRELSIISQWEKYRNNFIRIRSVQFFTSMYSYAMCDVPIASFDQ